MNINQWFPSKYLKAADLGGREFVLTIARVVVENVGQPPEKKPVVYFNKAEKGLILNRTNAMTIAGAYTPETDNWSGKVVTLYSTRVKAFGSMHDVIRVRIGGKGIAQPGAVAIPTSPSPSDEPEIDDAEDIIDDAGDMRAELDAVDDDANPFDDSNEPPSVHTDPPAATRVTDWQLNEISTIGKQIHGSAWDNERAKYAEWISRGTVNALSELTAKEAKALIEAMRKKLSKLAAEVQSNGKG